ncbi:FAD/NAD(P)-binding protein [Pseudomonas citrulli]|uniref:FAD/NAD(P)-binding protein n=1 Tax=Pseudomonas citrulli TaxID=3064347 RepID=A0ABT9BW09_9PSED|nr:FAD/NAD(P)-binding protein [Pseudomonas sp. K18]MDO7896185.1 FAD/NAD(P)-binding protein [Pseudomonas sp. K18]
MRIAIIGLGATGLLALAKTFSMAKRHPNMSVIVHAFDAQAPGQGVHRCDQADYLRLNTVAGQLSLFEDDDFTLFPRHSFRPSLYEWIAHLHPEAISGEQDRFAFLPRRYLGLYLQWYFTRLLEHIPINVRFETSCRLIRTIEEEPDGRFKLLASPPVNGAYDTLLLCTGHGVLPATRRATPFIAPYPLPASLEDIASDSAVAIQGVGLTAMDVVAALTTGRGGVFEQTANGLSYRPSGQEPRISLYSNSGMPYRARPEVDDAVIRYQPLVMTHTAIDRIRDETPGRRIDFEKDLLPLLYQEMTAAYYCACAGQDERNASRYQACYQQVWEQLQTAQAQGTLAATFDRLAQAYGPYAPLEALACEPPAHLTADTYPQWFLAQLEDDVRASALGCRRSPLKKSLEVWRDLRNQLCHAIDHRGLTAASHQTFFTRYCPLINRLVAGPQKERHAELIALIRSGVVVLLPGYAAADHYNPDTRTFTITLEKPEYRQFMFEHLIKANVNAQDTRRELHTLLGAITEQPTRYSPLAYGDFSCAHHPEFVHAHLRERIYIFGPVLEGSSYYNHYVPSNTPSRISAALEKSLSKAVSHFNHRFSEIF